MYLVKTECSITVDDFPVLPENDCHINLGKHDETHLKPLENSAQQAVQTDTGLNLDGLLNLFEACFLIKKTGISRKVKGPGTVSGTE